MPPITRIISLFLVIMSMSRPAAAFTLKDSDSRLIRFDHPFRRIISLYPAHTENLIAMGVDRELAGISRGCGAMPVAEGKPVFSYRDDPERILSAEPDLVLIRPMISRAYPDFISMLEKNGVTVVSLQPVSIKGMYRYWKELGMLSGRTEQAEGMCRKFADEIEKIRKKVNRIPETERKKVYFESIHKRMKTFAPGSIAMFVLETAGGINVMSDVKPVRNTNIAACGKERILAHASEIDVYLAQYGRMNRVSVDEIINEPGFDVIKAVRNHEVYLVNEEIVSRPTMRILEGIHAIMDILYGI